jgi:glycerol-3-phosphate dehydrogenase (NAD(P)+)
MKTLTVLGAGAWGTAVATLLAHNEHNVVLWCYEQEVADDINRSRCNGRYLPGIQLPKNIRATHSLQDAVQASTWLFEAVPVPCLRSVFAAAKAWVTPDYRVVMLSKGIEADTLLFPVNMIAQVLGRHNPIAVVSGPNFAQELAQQVPTATVVAADTPSLVQEVGQLVANGYFKVYTSSDVVGVQSGGAFKNVIALILGAAQGAGCRENTTAYFMTQGLHEMAQIARVLGGNVETVYGLSGFGDLVLCCTGTLSRNFKIGQQLGQRRRLTDLAAVYPMFPEGVNTLGALPMLIKQHALNLPLCTSAYEFVFKGKPFTTVVQRLMATKVG